MSERLNKCPKCKVIDNYKVLVVLNPETSDYNCKANLECNNCGYIWEDWVASPRYEEDKANGFIM